MELAKAYDPKLVEDRWYAEWLKQELFRAVPGEGEPYCITIPPPNITGSLHMGHALNNTIIDTMTRWHRMRGFNAVTVPGTDHAGIGTQNVVEKDLAKEGLTRHDLGREKFIERCWEWRKQYGDRIYLQFQKLGCAFDWERKRFTLDDSYVDAIYEEFHRWWDKGLIYRGARVVNWCPRCRSAISDIEVDSEERAGKLYHFRYPFADGSGHVTIATTRPETLLGDTAVAVNPADERYTSLIGKLLDLPLTDRQIPLIADDYAKMEFGTGAVKVTPAHDLDDFEAGQRNGLPQVVVIGEDGAMTVAAGPKYAGLDRFEARKRVLEDMEALGLVEKIEDYTVKIPLCDRCKTVLEPLLSEQWFVRMKPLAEPAVEVVKDGRVEITPPRYQRIYLDWMENIRDWCISRQLWWGHRIPVWWTENGRYMAARSAEEAAEKLGVPVSELRQDEDVLDTWFSSALWPHAVLGWPRDTEDLKFWYPTDLLSTAQEILFLWVARMIMTGLDFVHREPSPEGAEWSPDGRAGDDDGPLLPNGKRAIIPFRKVYIHATVLDEKGERMSKSKGNGVDPLDLIDQYGADALRFYLLRNTGRNQDIRFREDGVRLAGQFCNKLWNASRFVLSHVREADLMPVEPIDYGYIGAQWTVTAHAVDIPEAEACKPILHSDPRLTTEDRWILYELYNVEAFVDTHLDNLELDFATHRIYSFVWDEFCDWYIEAAKSRLHRGGEERDFVCSILVHVLDHVLRLLHPMMPFITEEIWRVLHSHVTWHEHYWEQPVSEKFLIQRSYPGRLGTWARREDELAYEQMLVAQEVVRAFRNIRAELGVTQGQRLQGAVVTQTGFFTNTSGFIRDRARLSQFEVLTAPPDSEGTWVPFSMPMFDIYLEIGEALDIDRELERIAKELASIEKDLDASDGRLGNAQFTEKAPAAVVEKERANNAALREKREKLEARRALLAR